MKHKKAILSLVILISIFLLLQWPTTTRQGVNFKVTEIKIPLYFKTLQFISRHYEMKHYTEQIIQNKTDDLTKIKILYSWMQTNIHPIPKGFDAIDDHPLHIFIRRYGASDQMDDLFSLMCSYAGLPSFFTIIRINQQRYPLAFVKYKNTWHAFDVYRQTEFIKEDQAWATLQDIQNNHFSLKISQNTIPPMSPEFYYSLLKDFNPETSFSTRNLQQMPWPRLKLFLGLKP